MNHQLVEMPMMASSNYVSNTIDQAMWAKQLAMMQGGGVQSLQVPFAAAPVRQPIPKETAPVAATPRRLIQIFIADPDENVPTDQCLLYSGEQKLTDLTDQELFFEVDVKSLLDGHNAKRVTMVNKAVKERTEMLEPARVRDLKMTVVTIASF